MDVENNGPRTKADLLRRIRAGRAAFDAALAAIPPEIVERPVLDDGGSVKDLVAHVAAYEQWTAAQIAAANEGRQPTDLELYGVDDVPDDPEGWDLDRQNAAIRARHAGLSFPEALAFAERSFDRLLTALSTTPDDDLTRPGAQSWTGREAVIDLVPGQTYEHYADHLPPLRRLAGNDAG
jgi:DinB family protein